MVKRELGQQAQCLGGRHSSATWVDLNGDFWLFGDLGFDNGTVRFNDLWTFQVFASTTGSTGTTGTTGSTGSTEPVTTGTSQSTLDASSDTSSSSTSDTSPPSTSSESHSSAPSSSSPSSDVLSSFSSSPQTETILITVAVVVMLVALVIAGAIGGIMWKQFSHKSNQGESKPAEMKTLPPLQQQQHQSLPSPSLSQHSSPHYLATPAVHLATPNPSSAAPDSLQSSYVASLVIKPHTQVVL
jgi:hypothetical protein